LRIVGVQPQSLREALFCFFRVPAGQFGRRPIVPEFRWRRSTYSQRLFQNRARRFKTAAAIQLDTARMFFLRGRPRVLFHHV
jgi:hypothetical protein